MTSKTATEKCLKRRVVVSSPKTKPFKVTWNEHEMFDPIKRLRKLIS